MKKIFPNLDKEERIVWSFFAIVCLEAIFLSVLMLFKIWM
jgi:hypothetical protein